jgi:hypothetical protein
VASGGVDVYRHIRFCAAERAAASDGTDIIAEGQGVERVAEAAEGWELCGEFRRKPGEVCEVTGLVETVDVGFFGGEGEVRKDLGFDGVQERRRD